MKKVNKDFFIVKDQSYSYEETKKENVVNNYLVIITFSILVITSLVVVMSWSN